MQRKVWIGKRGEEHIRENLLLFRAGPFGRVVDRRNDRTNPGYDFEVQRYNIFNTDWEIERHEVKTKSHKSKSFPNLSPNEKGARAEYGDEYFIDRLELPYYEERLFDDLFNDR
jgi:hypothetical protein